MILSIDTYIILYRSFSDVLSYSNWFKQK